MGVSKINSLVVANLAKIDSLAKANINKINNVGFFIDNISFDFDGANDYLSGGSAAASMWVKLDAMSANGVMWQITAETGTDNQLFILWQNEFGKIRGSVKLDGVANVVDSGSGLEGDDTWHHVVMTWLSGDQSASNNIVRLYIDGSQTDTDAIGNTWSDGSHNSIC